MIKVGIVGTGNIVGISHYHLMGLLKDGRAEIPAVFDVRKEGAEQWVKEHGLHARVCDTYGELLDMVDGVNICVPNAYHKFYALGAIKAGKHFLVEKPMAVNIEDCRALAEAVQEYSKCNMIGFVYRFSDTVQQARKLVQDYLGCIYSVSAWFGGKRLADPTLPMEWRFYRDKSGTGALGDFGSHLIDLAYYIAGQKYYSVSCMSTTAIPVREGRNGIERVENDDISVMCARSDSGLGNFTVSRIGMDDIMILVSGEGGLIQISLRKPEGITYWVKKIDGAYTGEVKTYQTSGQAPFDGWFEKEMRCYLDVIDGSTTAVPTIAHGLYVEEVLHAAELSSCSGREEQVWVP